MKMKLTKDIGEKLSKEANWFWIKTNVYQMFHFLYEEKKKKLFKLFYDLLGLSKDDSFQRIQEEMNLDMSYGVTGGYNFFYHFKINVSRFKKTSIESLLKFVRDRDILSSKDGLTYSEINNAYLKHGAIDVNSEEGKEFLELLPSMFVKVNNLELKKEFYFKKLEKLEYTVYNKIKRKEEIHTEMVLNHVLVHPTMLQERIMYEIMLIPDGDTVKEVTEYSTYRDLIDKPKYNVLGVMFDPTKERSYEIVNKFTGYKGQVKREVDLDQEVVKVYLEFINYMSQGDEELGREILSYFAYIVQNPGGKTQRLLYLVGETGCCKSEFLKFHSEQIIGDKYCLTTSRHEEVTGKWNTLLNNKLFINIEEGGVMKTENYNILKDIVTRDQFELTEKNQNTQEKKKNYFNIALTSNYLWAVRAEVDRRLLLVDYPPKDKAIIKRFIEKVCKKGGDDVFTYLHNYKIKDGWKSDESYISKSLKRILRNVAPDYKLFAIETFSIFTSVAHSVGVTYHIYKKLYDDWAKDETAKRLERSKLLPRKVIEKVKPFNKDDINMLCGFTFSKSRLGNNSSGGTLAYSLITRDAIDAMIKELYSVKDNDYLLQRYIYFRYNKKLIFKHDDREVNGTPCIRLPEIFKVDKGVMTAQDTCIATVKGYESIGDFYYEYSSALRKKDDTDEGKIDTTVGFKSNSHDFFGVKEKKEQEVNEPLVKQMNELKIDKSSEAENETSNVSPGENEDDYSSPDENDEDYSSPDENDSDIE